MDAHAVQRRVVVSLALACAWNAIDDDLGNFAGERIRASKDRTTDHRMRTTKSCKKFHDDDLQVVLVL